MLALRAHQGPTELHLDTIEIPKLAQEDVLIKVASAGLTPGTFTQLERRQYAHLPTTLGHEAAGTVSAIGRAVSSFAIGDRVRLHPNLCCRTCTFCRLNREQMCPEATLMGFTGFGKGARPLYETYHDGGLAEYVRAPYWLVDKLPDKVMLRCWCQSAGLGYGHVCTSTCRARIVARQSSSLRRQVRWARPRSNWHSYFPSVA